MIKKVIAERGFHFVEHYRYTDPVEPANESFQDTKLHESPLVNVQGQRVESQTQVSHCCAMSHPRVHSEHIS